MKLQKLVTALDQICTNRVNTTEFKAKKREFLYPKSSFSSMQVVWGLEERLKERACQSDLLPPPSLAAAPQTPDHATDCAFLQ